MTAAAAAGLRCNTCQMAELKLMCVALMVVMVVVTGEQQVVGRVL
jgi:hypothetical protein